MIPRGRTIMPRMPGSVTVTSPQALAEFIQRVPLLADMPDAERQTLRAHSRLDTFEAPAEIFRQGDAADRL